MEWIESDQNQHLKKIRALKQKKYRESYGQFVVEGSRFVAEALKREADIKVILVAENYLAANENLLKQYHGPLFAVKKGLLEKFLDTVTPQGIVAIVNKPVWSKKDLAQMSHILIIDGVQDPGNLGTLFRTALASGVDAVCCLKGTVDSYNDKTLRATMGAIFTLPIFSIDDEQWLVENLHQAGFELVIADIHAQQFYDEMIYPDKVALVVGNEGNGVQRLKKGDRYVKIPLYNEAESLNVAIAAGILLYTIKRQSND